MKCGTDFGRAFKMTPTTDVCVPAACASRVLGSAAFCSETCPCGHGGGDCDSDADCMPGLKCGENNLGRAFGMTATTDVCLPEACATRTIYSATFCSTACPCGVGGGHCDDDSECMPGLKCGNRNGAQFGAAASVNVCVKE